MPGGDQAVGPVVPRTDQHQDPHPRRAGHLPGALGHGQTGVLHQDISADSRPLRSLLEGRHLGGGDDLHAVFSPRWATTKATAYSREWDMLRDISLTSSRFARCLALP